MTSPQERLVCSVFFANKKAAKKKPNPAQERLNEAVRERALAEAKRD